MALAYDKTHKPIELSGAAYIRLVRGGKIGYQSPDGSSKLSPIREGPFRIVRRVGKLAYELELPKDWKIHPVISIIHLEQAHDDEYDRPYPSLQDAAPILVGDQEEHEIEKIVQQAGDRVLVRWRDGSEDWEPLTTIQEDVPELLRRFQQKQRSKRHKDRN